MTSRKPDSDTDSIEVARLEAQVRLDAERSALERNKWGQFATPPVLACDIMQAVMPLVPSSGLSFLEPSCGSGSFFSALVRSLPDSEHTLESAVGVELDERFAALASELWSSAGLDVVSDDFINFASRSDYKANLLVANPPYVRHHHIGAEQKQRLAAEVAKRFSWKVSGLSGLYVYFVLLSHHLLQDGSVSAWLIPTEFMDVNYGAALRRYLTTEVTLLSLHRFDPDDVQFDDALVSSAVVVFRKERPQADHKVSFSFGGSVRQPRDVSMIPLSNLNPERKWNRDLSATDSHSSAGPTLADYFKIRRGLATGSNKFFILPRSRAVELGISPSNLKPILPSPRSLDSLHVEAAADGWPLLDSPLALIDSALSEADLEKSDPALWAYLNGPDSQSVRAGYLVTKRSPWYRQEQRPPAPFLCTYMGRGSDDDRPFRFIRNDSMAVATNMFLMLYPTPHLLAALAGDPALLPAIHEALLALTGEDLRLGGRVYGGGLHKIEPKELAALPARRLEELVGLPESDPQLPLN